jgi:hypothetical protein
VEDLERSDDVERIEAVEQDNLGMHTGPFPVDVPLPLRAEGGAIMA